MLAGQSGLCRPLRVGFFGTFLQCAQCGAECRPGRFAGRARLEGREEGRHSAFGVETFASRGWTDAEWSAARDRLESRGFVDVDGVATDHGRELRDSVERATDDLAYGPWQALGAEKAERLAQLTMPILVKILETGLMPAQNTLGIGKVQAPPRRA